MPFRTKILILSLLLNPVWVLAQNISNVDRYQQPDSVVTNSILIQKIVSKLVQKKTKKLARFELKQQKSQQKVLQKLSKQEKRFLTELAKKDSASYLRQVSKVGYDSILKLSKQNSVVGKASSEVHGVIDSIKKLESYYRKYSSRMNKELTNTNLNSENKVSINELESKLIAQTQINSLIKQRTSELEGIKKNFLLGSSFKGIQKTGFYYQQRLKGYKRIVDDPSILEEKAVFFLKRVPGFESAMSTDNSPSSSMGGAQNVEDLEKMGLQTKRQVKAQLDKQFGIKTPEQVQKLQGKLTSAQKEIQNAKSQSIQIKNSIKQLGFKPNPMRGTPLRYRLAPAFNWQVIQAVNANPVTVGINGQLGYKHSGSLTTNLVAGTSIGLGKDWQHIHMSYQGLRIGFNTDWKWILGISGQAGFERVYKDYKTSTLLLNEGHISQQVVTNTHHYRDIAYTGIQKTYKLNSKYSGTMLIAYDWLWKRGFPNSPVIWRFGWRK